MKMYLYKLFKLVITLEFTFLNNTVDHVNKKTKKDARIAR